MIKTQAISLTLSFDFQAFLSNFAGNPTLKDMKKAAIKLLSDKHITAIKSVQQWQDFISAQTLPVVLLVSEKTTVAPLYKAQSLRFKNRLAFARASAKATDLSAALGIDSIPAIAIVKASGTELYEGELSSLFPPCFRWGSKSR